MIYLIDYIERLRTLLALIKREKTGSRETLAKTLHVTGRTVYNYLKELRALGAKIAYDLHRRTYYLQEQFDIELTIKN